MSCTSKDDDSEDDDLVPDKIPQKVLAESIPIPDHDDPSEAEDENSNQPTIDGKILALPEPSPSPPRDSATFQDRLFHSRQRRTLSAHLITVIDLYKYTALHYIYIIIHKGLGFSDWGIGFGV